MPMEPREMETLRKWLLEFAHVLDAAPRYVRVESGEWLPVDVDVVADRPEGYVRIDRLSHTYARYLADRARHFAAQLAPGLEMLPTPRSSHIHAVGYDADQRRLYVRFRSAGGDAGHTWAYDGVPPELWTELADQIGAGSVGKLFHLRIRNQYEGHALLAEEAPA